MMFGISDIAGRISKYARSDFRSRKAAAEDAFSKPEKSGERFLNICSRSERGEIIRKLAYEAGAWQCRIGHWQSMFPRYYARRSVNERLLLRAPFRHDSSGLLPTMRGSNNGHTRLIECMDVGQ